jgi:recombination protein RecA
VSDEEKLKAIQAAMKNVETAFGKGSIMRLGENVRADVAAISTGSLSLDLALGVGGIPRGRITEVYGNEMAGKTLLCLTVIASAQKLGGECVFIDAEHALSREWAAKIGVDVNRLIVHQPDYGEMGLQVADEMICSGGIDVIVVDSVAALVPKVILEGA